MAKSIRYIQVLDVETGIELFYEIPKGGKFIFNEETRIITIYDIEEEIIKLITIPMDVLFEISLLEDMIKSSLDTLVPQEGRPN